uniref:uncharacterized protein LOC120345454 n=1 Tax=Styela clava TaxID=7725 RepID=UPI001939C33E|nr:uncharacterized protein LOC120345454 [Styela clava]
MPGTINNALQVVAPYGSNCSMMPTADSKSSISQKAKKDHRKIQDILGDLKPKLDISEDNEVNHAASCVRKGQLVSENSIKNLCLDLSHGMHLKPVSTRKVNFRNPVRSTPVHPPQNSFIDDPKFKTEVPTTRNVIQSYVDNTYSKNIAVHLKMSAKEKRPSSMIYEFNKVCRMISHLPNPVSRQLYEEMHNRRIKSSELMQLRDMPCYKEHVEHHEPPCITYFSPKPSQLYLHKKEDRLEKAVKSSLESNSAVQAPLSTVKVFFIFYIQLEFESRSFKLEDRIQMKRN